MKKIFYFFSILLFLSSCKDDKTSPSTNNITTSNVDYEFTIKFAGKTHKVMGNTSQGNYLKNICIALPSSGWGIQLGIQDPTLPTYISGDQIGEIITIPSLTSVGTTNAYLNFSWALSNPSTFDYLNKLGTSIVSGASLSLGYFHQIAPSSGLLEIPLTITDLGTPSTYASY